MGLTCKICPLVLYPSNSCGIIGLQLALLGVKVSSCIKKVIINQQCNALHKRLIPFLRSINRSIAYEGSGKMSSALHHAVETIWSSMFSSGHEILTN